MPYKKAMHRNAAEARPKRNKHADRDDADIAILEKKLGIKKTRLPKAFEEDGLGYLIKGLDEGSSTNRKRKPNEDDEWLLQKRKRSLHEINGEGNSLITSQSCRPVSETNSQVVARSWSESSSDEATDFARERAVKLRTRKTPSFSSDPSQSTPVDSLKSLQSAGRPRENPYVAPRADNPSSAAAYVPPHLRVRDQDGDDDENMKLMRRQIKRLFNKLSDDNILSILADVEQLYQSNPRQLVTGAIVDLLLNIVCDPAPLSDHFIITHAGLTSAVFKVVGPDFGAQVLERFVETLDEQYSLATSSSIDDSEREVSSRKTKNVYTALCQLYNLQVISASIIFDYIRTFLPKLSEFNSELLWIVVRLSGAQLRASDASALRHITQELEKLISEQGEAKVSVRTRFVVENIIDLKNNKLKAGTPGRALTAEIVHRLRKTLGQLNDRHNVMTTEPLRVNLADIRDRSKKGKWWLIGSSWKGEFHPSAPLPAPSEADNLVSRNASIKSDGDVSFDVLAKSEGMNTAIRRAIFVVLLSASDFADAHLQLSKLALRRSQQPEIARVLLHCAGAEPGYNPYYTLIAKRLCSQSTTKTGITGEGAKNAPGLKMHKAFQYVLWNLVERLEETNQDQHLTEKDEEKSLSSSVQQARCYGELIADETLPITILRRLDMTALKPKSKAFFESLLLTIIKRTAEHRSDSRVTSVFSKALEHPRLAIGISWLIENNIMETDLTKTKKEKGIVKRQCKIIKNLLADAGTSLINNSD